MAVNTAGALTAFVVAHAITFASILCFGWLRNLSSTRRFYAPKRYDTNQVKKPQRLPSGWILWIWHLIWIPEDHVIDVAGLDSAVYLRVLRMIWEIFMVVGIWCLAVVLPVNLSGNQIAKIMGPPSPPPRVPGSSPLWKPFPPNHPPRAPYAPNAPEPPSAPFEECFSLRSKIHLYDVSDFDKCSLTNVEDKSHKLWAHIISAYVVTGVVVRFLMKYNNEMTKLRILFLANAPKGGPSHTVLVQDVPGIAFGTVPWSFRETIDGPVFRMLPKSWRQRMAGAVDAVFLKGFPLPIKRGAKEAVRWAANGINLNCRSNNSVARPSAQSGDSKKDSQKFSYSQHARQLAAQDTGLQSPNGEQGDFCNGQLSPDRNGHSKPPSFLASGAPHLSLMSRASSAGTAVLRTGVSESSSEDDVDLRTYAMRFNVDLHPPEMAKVHLDTINSLVLDVWAIASDFLQRPPMPGQPAPTLRDMVDAEFKYVYGKNAIAEVNPVWDQNDIDPLIAEFKRVRIRLEDYLDWAAFQLRRRKKLQPRLIRIIPVMYGGWGTKNFGVRPVRVEALRFWPMRLQHLAAEIEEAKKRAEGVRVTPSAFVTFNSRVAHVVATTTLHQHHESMWRVVPAPEPQEVLWANIKLRAWQRAVRIFVHWAAYIVIVCIYMVPITVVQGFIAIPALFPEFSEKYSSHSAMTSLMQSILPGVILRIFFRPMPYILALLCRYTGFISISSVDLAVVVRYTIFLGVVMFFGSLVSGSVLSQIKDVLENPSAIIKTMALSVPQTATFFINYMCVAGLATNSVTFLNLTGLALFFVRSRIASNPRQRARLWAKRYTSYSQDLPHNMMMFLFGIVFSIINPVMCIAVTSYFSFTSVYERYILLYVRTRKYETGGLIWGIIVNKMIIALYTMQVILMIVISLKSFAMSAFLVPLIIATAIFHFSCMAFFKRPWTELSLHDASYLDYKDRKSRENHDKKLTEAEKSAIREMYLSPAFKRSAHEIDDLLMEAEKVQRLIAGESLENVMRDFMNRGLIEGSETAAPNERGTAGASDDDAEGQSSPPSAPAIKLQLDRWRGSVHDGPVTAAGAGQTVSPPGRQRPQVHFRTDLESGVGTGTTAVHTTRMYGTTLMARRTPQRVADGSHGAASAWGPSCTGQAAVGTAAATAAAAVAAAEAGTGPSGGRRAAPALATPLPAAGGGGRPQQTTLALVSALVEQVGTMSGGEREELQVLLRTSIGACGGSSGGGGDAQSGPPAARRRGRGQ